MAATLAVAAKSDPAALLNLMAERPEAFDAIWYAAFPPTPVGDVDAILNR